MRCANCGEAIPAGSDTCPLCGFDRQGKPPALGQASPVQWMRPSVVLAGLDVPFGQLVWFLVKVAIAAVPAMIIVAAFWFFVIAVLGGLGSAMGS